MSCLPILCSVIACLFKLFLFYREARTKANLSIPKQKINIITCIYYNKFRAFFCCQKISSLLSIDSFAREQSNLFLKFCHVICFFPVRVLSSRFLLLLQRNVINCFQEDRRRRFLQLKEKIRNNWRPEKVGVFIVFKLSFVSVCPGYRNLRE